MTPMGASAKKLAVPATVPARAAISWMARIGEQPPDVSWYGDLQPVPQHRVRVHDRAHNEDVDQVYRANLQVLWLSAGIHKALEGPLAVVMTFAGCSKTFAGRLPRPDESNLVKAVEDAGNGVLWTDDRQIVLELGWIRAWGKDVKPLVTVDVWRLPDGHDDE